MTLKLFQKEIKDEYSQDNFQRIQDEVNKSPFNKLQAKFYEVTFGRSTATFPLDVEFTHNLGFQPKDVIPLSVIGGTITWNYDEFTRTTISVTVSAVTTVRFFLGRYEEGEV